MNYLQKHVVSVLISILALQPALTAATEYRIPLNHKVKPGATQPGSGPGSGDGDIEVGDGPAAPKLLFTPASQVFDISSAGDMLRTSLLVNSGRAPATLTGLASNSVFSIHHDCPVTLAPGDACLVSAVRSESAPANASYALKVLAQGSANSAVLNLSTETRVIREGEPFLMLDKEMVNLGETIPGVSTSGSAVLTNKGSGYANLRGIVSSPEFLVTSDCPTDLAPNASCTIVATFQGTTGGTRYHGLNLRTTQEGLGKSLLFYVEVLGAKPPAAKLQFSQPALSFGPLNVSEKQTKEVTLYNTGTAPTSLTALKSTPDFYLQSNCPATLPAAGQCTVSITFTGLDAGTWPTYHLEVTGTDTSAQLYLQGEVAGRNGEEDEHGPKLTYQPKVVAFGTVPVGQPVAQQAVLSNTGDEPASIENLVVDTSADEFYQANDCGKSLAPGASCTVTISHKASYQDIRSGRIAVSFSGGRQSFLPVWSYGVQAILATAPSSIQYGGSVFTEHLPPKGIALFNRGNIPLMGLAVINTDNRLFIDSSKCANTLAPQDACSLLVSYSPTSDGPFSTSFQVKSDNGGTANIAVTGTTVRLSASPSELTFPQTKVGKSAPDQYVTLSNQGLADVTLDGISTTAGQESFNQSNNCGATLAAGASCSLAVRFTPVSADPAFGVVSVAAAGALAANVTVKGSALQPRLTLSSSSLQFPSTNINNTAAPLSVIVTNPDDEPATISGISVMENWTEFSQSNNCGGDIAPGSSCTVNVQWRPTEPGKSSGIVALSSSLGLYSIGAVGIATKPVGEVEDPPPPPPPPPPPGGGPPPPPAPVLITFPDTQVSISSGVRNITFSNKGDGPLAIHGISMVEGLSDFNQSNNCGTVLAPMTSCVIAMRFTPSEIGERGGMLTLVSETGQYTFVLKGNGIGSIVELVADSSSDFGEVLVGAKPQRRFTFRNIGTVAARQVVASLEGDNLSLMSSSCGTVSEPAIVQPNDTCSVIAEFAPTTPGILKGKLVVSSDAVNGTQQLPVTGKAVQALGELAADTSTDFGTVQTDSTKSLTFTFFNKGDAPATGVFAKLEGSDMALAANSCGSEAVPISIAPGKICTMTVRFSPTTQASKEGILSVYSSATNGMQSLKLTGAGKLATKSYALQFNGANGSTSIQDTGANAAWASYNGAAITTNFYREGSGSLQLNGVNQAIYGPNIAYTGDFSVSTWIRMTARPATLTGLAGQWRQGTGFGGWLLAADNAGRLSVYWGPYSESTALTTSSASLPLNKWSRVALSRTGSTFKVYIDGVVVATGSHAGNLQPLDVPTSFGNYYNSSGALAAWNFFAGQLDDIRITVGSGAVDVSYTSPVLSGTSTEFGSVAVGDRVTKSVPVTNSANVPALIEAVTASGDYSVTNASACTTTTLAPGASCNVTVTFAPAGAGARSGSLTVISDAQNSPMTVVLSGTGLYSGVTALKLLGEASTIVDSEGATLTVGGSPSVTKENSVDGTGSILFPAKGSNLVTPRSTKYSMGSADFTIEAWVRPVWPAAYDSVVLSNYPNGSWAPNSWALITAHSNTGNVASFWMYNVGTLVGTSYIPLNVWTHIAVTRTGSVFRMYVNGKLEGTLTSAAAIDTGLTAENQLGVGKVGNSYDFGFSGQLDDVRVTRGQAIYSSNFTPPTNMQ